MTSRVLLLPLLTLALGAPAASGQAVSVDSLLQTPRTTPARFYLSPAGARALGLGGAFVALADDPSAADLNPAGLSRLEGPRLLASLRSSSFDTDFEGGLAPAGTTTSASTTGPAFVGYTHPLGSVTLTGYYQQDARFESGVRFESPFVHGGPELASFAPLLLTEERRFDQEVETLGVAIAGRLDPALSLGAALRRQRLSLEWVDGYRFALDTLDIQPSLGFRSEIDDSDADYTVALGLLVHPEGRWSLGLSYQQGGDFGLSGLAGFASPGLPAPLELFRLRRRLPDAVNAGVALRPRERWLVSAQVSRLAYSHLEAETYGELVVPDLAGDEPIDDATRVHLGAEVALGSGERPFRLRAGAWHDPDHDGIRGIDGDELHATLGGGKALSGRLALDGAVHLGDTVTEGVLSLGVRF